MAEEEERELTEEEQAEAARKAKRKRWMLLVLLAVLLVAISVGMTLTLLYFLGGEEPGKTPDSVVEEKMEEVEPETQKAIYYPLKEKFVINYNVRGRQRFLQAEMNLMFRDNRVAKAIEQHMPRIRNDMIMLFSGQEFEDLQTPEGRELLRQDAVRQVRSILEEETGEPGVEQVLFTSFVMQ